MLSRSALTGQLVAIEILEMASTPQVVQLEKLLKRDKGTDQLTIEFPDSEDCGLEQGRNVGDLEISAARNGDPSLALGYVLDQPEDSVNLGAHSEHVECRGEVRLD